MKAVIFDLDGTIISNEIVYGEVFGEILRGLGAGGVPSYPHIGGIGVVENWPILLKKYKLKTEKTIKDLAEETQKLYVKKLDKVTLKKGFRKFYRQIKHKGLKTALATSNDTVVTNKVLSRLEITDYFDAIVTGDMVSSKKPNPEIFIKASEKIGVEKPDCLVFEDSKAGVKAGTAAGMRIVGVYRDKEHKKELSGAKLLIKNFDDPVLQELFKL